MDPAIPPIVSLDGSHLYFTIHPGPAVTCQIYYPIGSTVDGPTSTESVAETTLGSTCLNPKDHEHNVVDETKLPLPVIIGEAQISENTKTKRSNLLAPPR